MAQVSSPSLPTLDAAAPPAAMRPPSDADAAAAVADARAIFRRTLAGWASDLLLLRHAGLLEPTWARPADPLDVAA